MDAAAEAVYQAPHAGERSKGELATQWAFKFKGQGQLYLLNYTLDEGVKLDYLEAIGSHENFYRDIKR